MIPGPPLRGMSSPPATSITKICTSASAGLKIAVRLSPPLSTNTRSSGAGRASSSATASRLAEMSSRIAVCGQPPVSTARIRSAGSTPVRRRNCGVLGRVDVVRDDADARARRRARGRARRRGELLPEPTGPPMPIRRARSAGKERSLSRAGGRASASSSAGAKPAGQRRADRRGDRRARRAGDLRRRPRRASARRRPGRAAAASRAAAATVAASS